MCSSANIIAVITIRNTQLFTVQFDHVTMTAMKRKLVRKMKEDAKYLLV